MYEVFTQVGFVSVADSNGNVEKDLWNEGTKHKHVKYYYQNGEECKQHLLTLQ